MKKSSFSLAAFPMLLLSALVISSCGGGGGGGGAPPTTPPPPPIAFTPAFDGSSAVSSTAFLAEYSTNEYAFLLPGNTSPSTTRQADRALTNVDLGDAMPAGADPNFPPAELEEGASAEAIAAYQIALNKYNVSQAFSTCRAVTSLCENIHALEDEANGEDDVYGRFIPGYQELLGAFFTAGRPNPSSRSNIFFHTDLSLISNLDDTVGEVDEADEFQQLFATMTLDYTRLIMQRILRAEAERMTTVHCFQVSGDACSDTVVANDVVMQVVLPDISAATADATDNRNVEPSNNINNPLIVIPAAAMANYGATVTAARGRVVFVAPLYGDDTSSTLCDAVPTGAYCVGAPAGFYFYSNSLDDVGDDSFFAGTANVDDDDRAFFGYNGDDAHHTAATIISAVAGLIKNRHTSISLDNLASLINHCANGAGDAENPDTDSIIDLNCLFNPENGAFLSDISELITAITGSARPVSTLGAFPSFGFAVQALPYTDEFGRDFPIPVSYSYSDGSNAPLTNPASSILSPMNSNKPQALALYDKNAFVHAVKIPLGSRCLLAAAAAVEHSSFNGSYSSSNSSFSLGDSLTPFIGASCSKNPRKNLSLTAWAAQRSPMLVNPDPSSLIQGVSGQETIFGVQASLLAPLNSQITLSLRHGSGVRGEALVAGQTLALHPESWSAASLSLNLPF